MFHRKWLDSGKVVIGLALGLYLKTILLNEYVAHSSCNLIRKMLSEISTFCKSPSLMSLKAFDDFKLNASICFCAPSNSGKLAFLLLFAANRRGVGRLRRPSLRIQRLQNATKENDEKKEKKQPGLKLRVRPVRIHDLYYLCSKMGRLKA